MDNNLNGWYPGICGWFTDDKGTKRHCLAGVFHKEDGPASIHKDGTLFWYKEGVLHNASGPAIIYVTGNSEWYLNGKKVRREDVLDTPEKREAYLLEESLRRL